MLPEPGGAQWYFGALWGRLGAVACRGALRTGRSQLVWDEGFTPDPTPKRDPLFFGHRMGASLIVGHSLMEWLSMKTPKFYGFLWVKT